jgi:hypothetical protein
LENLEGTAAFAHRTDLTGLEPMPPQTIPSILIAFAARSRNRAVPSLYKVPPSAINGFSIAAVGR